MSGTANVVEKKLKKNQYLLFLDVKEDLTMAANEWKRIDKSTVLSISMNPQTETNEWIDLENAEEDVVSNQPELGQEIACYEGNPIYDFLSEKFFNMPTGQECKVPSLMCFGGSGKKAWRSTSTIIFDSLDAVAGKLTYTIKLGGNVEKGTYSIAEGAPTFTKTEG